MCSRVRPSPLEGRHSIPGQSVRRRPTRHTIPPSASRSRTITRDPDGCWRVVGLLTLPGRRRVGILPSRPGRPSGARTRTRSGPSGSLACSPSRLRGTSAFADRSPAVDATVVTRIVDAGSVILGKAHCECLPDLRPGAARAPLGHRLRACPPRPRAHRGRARAERASPTTFSSATIRMKPAFSLMGQRVAPSRSGVSLLRTRGRLARHRASGGRIASRTCAFV